MSSALEGLIQDETRKTHTSRWFRSRDLWGLGLKASLELVIRGLEES